VRQLIARIDEDLHARLKDRAAAERRSVNSLVRELLEHGVSKDDARTQLRRRVAALGLLVVPPQPRQPPPSRNEAIAATRGAGTAVTDALAEDRARR
jgi:plasmid stability protein